MKIILNLFLFLAIASISNAGTTYFPAILSNCIPTFKCDQGYTLKNIADASGNLSLKCVNSTVSVIKDPVRTCVGDSTVKILSTTRNWTPPGATTASGKVLIVGEDSSPTCPLGSVTAEVQGTNVPFGIIKESEDFEYFSVGPRILYIKDGDGYTLFGESEATWQFAPKTIAGGCFVHETTDSDLDSYPEFGFYRDSQNRHVGLPIEFLYASSTETKDGQNVIRSTNGKFPPFTVFTSGSNLAFRFWPHYDSSYPFNGDNFSLDSTLTIPITVNNPLISQVSIGTYEYSDNITGVRLEFAIAEGNTFKIIEVLTEIMKNDDGQYVHIVSPITPEAEVSASASYGDQILAVQYSGYRRYIIIYKDGDLYKISEISLNVKSELSTNQYNYYDLSENNIGSIASAPQKTVLSNEGDGYVFFILTEDNRVYGVSTYKPVYNDTHSCGPYYSVTVADPCS